MRANQPVPFWRSPVMVSALALVPFLIVTVDQPLSRMSRDLDPWIMGLFSAFSEAGDSKWSLVPAGVAVILATLLRLRAKTVRARQIWAWCIAVPGFLFACVALSGLLVIALKFILGRARPGLLDREGIYGFQPFSIEADFHSLPSGHANTMFAIGLVLALFFPRLRLVILSVAAVMAYSRVVVGAHYLSDLVAGAMVAVMTTAWFAAWFARRGWAFELDRHGRRRLQAPGRWLKRRAVKAVRRGLAAGPQPLLRAFGRPASRN